MLESGLKKIQESVTSCKILHENVGGVDTNWALKSDEILLKCIEKIHKSAVIDYKLKLKSKYSF